MHTATAKNGLCATHIETALRMMRSPWRSFVLVASLLVAGTTASESFNCTHSL